MTDIVEIRIRQPEGTSATSFHVVGIVNLATGLVVIGQSGPTADRARLLDWENFRQDVEENGTLSLDEVNARYGL